MGEDYVVSVVDVVGRTGLTATAVLTLAATALITLTATAVLAGTATVVVHPMWVNLIRRVDVTDVFGIFVLRGSIVFRGSIGF